MISTKNKTLTYKIGDVIKMSTTEKTKQEMSADEACRAVVKLQQLNGISVIEASEAIFNLYKIISRRGSPYSNASSFSRVVYDFINGVHRSRKARKRTMENIAGGSENNVIKTNSSLGRFDAFILQVFKLNISTTEKVQLIEMAKNI